MKKILKITLSLLLIASLLFGCTNMTSDNALTTDSNTETVLWPRTIVDATGKSITLEKNQKELQYSTFLYMEYFFALETQPVASTGSSAGNAMAALKEWETLKLYAETAEIFDLGSARNINIEAILEAKPDVIVTFKGHVDKIYDQLNEIAPVIQIDFDAPWQEQTMSCAEIVGKDAFAKEYINETEKIIASAKEQLAKNSDKTTALFRTDGKSFISRGNKAYYDAFGITKPSRYPDDYQSFSLEAVAEMNPDFIVFQDVTNSAKQFVATQEESAVWKTINGVKNNKIAYFDDSFNTFGPLSMRLTADKLVQLYSN